MRLYTQIGLTLSCLSIVLQAQTASNATNAATAPAAGLGDTNPAIHSLSLQEAIQMAIEHNFSIAIARFQPQISQYQLNGAYAYYDPRLSFNATHDYRETEPTFVTLNGSPIGVFPGTKSITESFGPSLGSVTPWGLSYTLSGGSSHSFGTGVRDSYGADTGIRLTQPLLRDFWIDGGRLTIQLSKKDLKISEFDLLTQVMETIRAVEEAYYNLIAAQDDVKSRQSSLGLAKRLVDENRQRVRVGTMAPLDEKQAESEAAQREADLIQVQANVIRQENFLKNLISDNYETWHALTIAPTEKLIAVPQMFDLQNSWQKGLALRPDLNKAKVQLERQGLVVKYDFNQLFPSLNLTGTYGRGGSDFAAPGHDASFSGTLADVRDEMAPRYSYGVVLSMPLTMRAERNRYKADKAILKQQELTMRALHQQILVNIETALKVAQADYQGIQATRAAREFAQAALDAEQTKYENGKSTPFVVLRLQRDLTAARAAEISALAKYNVDLSELSFFEGTILDKNRVTVQFK